MGKSWAEIAKDATRPQRKVTLCLRGDLHAKLTEFNGTNDELVALKKEIDENSVTFVIEGLSRQKFRALEADHPAEKEDAGWNLDTFPEALVRAALVDPVIADDEPFFDILTGGQVEQLFEAAFKASVDADPSSLI